MDDRVPARRDVGRRTYLQSAQHTLALALAMAKRPELLILDEPVASLDPHTDNDASPARKDEFP